jgi:hypothetical protein
MFRRIIQVRKLHRRLVAIVNKTLRRAPFVTTTNKKQFKNKWPLYPGLQSLAEAQSSQRKALRSLREKFYLAE